MNEHRTIGIEAGRTEGHEGALVGRVGAVMARGFEIVMSHSGESVLGDREKEQKEFRRLQGIKLAGSLALHPTLGERARNPDAEANSAS
jgi:hypothetical protein